MIGGRTNWEWCRTISFPTRLCIFPSESCSSQKFLNFGSPWQTVTGLRVQIIFNCSQNMSNMPVLNVLILNAFIVFPPIIFRLIYPSGKHSQVIISGWTLTPFSGVSIKITIKCLFYIWGTWKSPWGFLTHQKGSLEQCSQELAGN